MIKLLLLFLLILLFPLLLHAQQKDGSWLHFGAGVLISYTTSEIIFYKTNNLTLSTWGGLLSATGAGLSKEWVYDRRINSPSVKDAWMTSMGGFTGVITFGCRINFKEERKTKTLKIADST